jgi:hypothetical protein
LDSSACHCRDRSPCASISRLFSNTSS